MTVIGRLSWRNKIARGIWTIVYWLLFRPFPTKLFNPWRLFVLRCFGAHVHRRSGVYASCRIWCPWNLTLAENAWIGRDVDCYNVAMVTLGENVIVSQGAYLCTASHDVADKSFPLITGSIVVGAQAWVAARAFVGPGVTVGEGAVVGACAVVTKDVEPWTVVAGNPARVIGKRVIRETTDAGGEV
jgi:putative colanic acid biosynthesis acetyltransferase WcaF